ncbi:hypothetical protein PHYPSEUDO_012336 [Phytophthora pseudosyringae]|uniref:Bzip transcription factor n=1 Tax=Phytophthora pseudosyringae TaxID=221518 RepID=A0A8T1VA79_9STRA|nr:hypothetical protein PHYPSEUDO_012336 [Phytophthora pseudosyringae]
MDACILRAPAKQRVGGVVSLQADTARQWHFQPRTVEDTWVTGETPTTLMLAPATDAAVDGLLSLTSEKRKREATKPFSPSKRQLPVSPVGSETQTPATDTESLASENCSEGGTNRRELDQITGQSRKKQDDHEKTLEVENREIRDQIEKLERRRRSMSTPLPANANVWNVALEYFRIFRNGLQSRTQPSVRNHFAFLRAAMAPDMVFNSGRGPKAMIRTWKCISLWFQDVELEIEGMGKGSVGSLVAATTTRMTITERTLRNVFPHLCDTSGKYKGLAEKLDGQRVVMRGSIRFEWDPAQRRVSSVTAQSDLLRPILRLVGNVEEASQVFEKSIISPTFQWRSSPN